MLPPRCFSEMPTPSSWHGTQATTPNGCYGQQTPIQSTCVPDGNSNLSEQNLDGMPQPYGFHHLKIESVFCADGTEHRYYALPENYPLERATPKPLFSNESADVFATTPEQQTYEEEQQEGEQLLECFSKALETEHNIACLNIISDVRDFTLEQQHQDNEKASVHVQQLRAPPLNVLVIHETRNEWDPGVHPIRSSTRTKTIVGVLQTSILTQETANHLTECNSLKYMLQSAEIRYPRTLSYSFFQRYRSAECDSWLNTVLQSMGDQVEGLKPLSPTTPWDPGVLVMHSGITRNSTRITRHAEWLKFSSPTSCECPGQAPKCFSKPIFSLERPTVGVFSLTNEQSICDLEKKNDSENLLFTKQNIEQLLNCSSKALKCRTFDEESQDDEKILWEKSVCQTATGHSILFFPWDPGDTKLHVLFTTAAGATKLQCTDAYKSAMVHILLVQFSASRASIFEPNILRSYTFGLAWTEVNAAAVFVLAVTFSKGKPVAKHSMFMPNGGTCMTNHSFPKLLMQLLCASTTVQVTEQRHTLEFSLMVAMLPNGSEYTDGQQAYMPLGTSSDSSEWVRHVVIVLSCRFPSFEMAKLQWDPGIGTPSSIYLWLQGLTARIETEKPWSWLPIPELTKWQSQMASVSFVWYPGTMLLWYKSKWWLLFTEEKINWHNDMKCFGVALWLIHFQPP